MGRLIIYFRKKPRADRFFPGDRFIIPLIKRFIKPAKVSGIDKVFINLCKSLRELEIDFKINLPFDKIKPEDKLVVIGEGRYSLEGYQKPNKVIAGIALMTHPSQWPSLTTDYPIVKYLQHSEWAKNVYVPYYGGSVCDTWFAGIDTDRWQPDDQEKKYDFLVYNKIRWDHEKYNRELKYPILKTLEENGWSYKEIVYGRYTESEYFNLLKQSRAKIFLCEHESQGFACCEALSMDVPVFAWDQGWCLDPERFGWGDPEIPATSVPFFDERCGERFKDAGEFIDGIKNFRDKAVSGFYAPREYVLQNLTLRKSGERMMEIINSVYQK